MLGSVVHGLWGDQMDHGQKLPRPSFSLKFSLLFVFTKGLSLIFGSFSRRRWGWVSSIGEISMILFVPLDGER